jgi:hypothetical protein
VSRAAAISVISRWLDDRLATSHPAMPKVSKATMA